MNTILNYLRQLEKNNNKPWFDAHKKEYLEARAHFNAIVERLIEGICSFDSTIKGIGIKESTYRIHKDMRFSKDGFTVSSKKLSNMFQKQDSKQRLVISLY